MIHYQDDRVVLHRGDCREVLRALPEASVHCVVTSPPYWGLRDYGVEPLTWGGEAGCRHAWEPPLSVHKGGPTGPHSTLVGRAGNLQRDATKDWNAGAFCARCGAWRGSLGLEPTPELYVAHLVGIFREIRRVLRPDGVVWLNLGDCYATGAGQVGEHPGGGAQGARWAGRREGDQLGEEGSDRSETWRTRLAGRGRHDAGNSGKAAPRLEAMGPMTQPNRLPLPGLKPKDLVGIPWRVAFALQADGWWLRSDVVWAKGASFLEGWAGSVMPESVTDRPTRAHEYLFLLARSERYYYDADAIRERSVTADEARWDPGTDGHQGGLSHAGAGASTRRFRQARPSGWCEHGEGCRCGELLGRYPQRVKVAARPSGPMRHENQRPAPQPGFPNAFHPLGRNVRSVWAINPAPFPEAHFATFPPRLVAPCVLAGTSERTCPACGASWARVVDQTPIVFRQSPRQAAKRAAGLATALHGTLLRPARHAMVGWRPTCEHYDLHYRELPRARRQRTRAQREASGAWWRRARARPGLAGWPWAPAVVLDPFAGACTTLLVAKDLGRRAVGVELKPDYCGLGDRRLRQEVLPL